MPKSAIPSIVHSLFAAAFVVLFCIARASAHDARPLSVNIIEQSAGLYIAHIRVPPAVPAEDMPQVVWPEKCAIAGDDVRALATDGRETTTLGCKDGLEGQRIRVTYRVFNPSLPTLFRLREMSGKVLTRVLPPDQLDWEVPKTPGWKTVAASYLELGVRHIWTGIDHLLFVTGLLVLAGTLRRALLAITGFTIAHSVTLSLSALNLAVLPEPPVEAAIALSILFLAREIASPFPDGLAGRFPIVVSSSFGLLHGFGFAAALREVGLPTKELAVGLLCFNLGVEIGQIIFIAGLIVTVVVVRRLVQRGKSNLMMRQLGLLSGYALGIPAAFWFIQRLGAF
ncbi:MAG TPA: HupE/UreJ family protein [Alphaproteobacteria bacterium]|nr:HupE/UreJ family protein [Alphaproteobacteria bacterium]